MLKKREKKINASHHDLLAPQQVKIICKPTYRPAAFLFYLLLVLELLYNYKRVT